MLPNMASDKWMQRLQEGIAQCERLLAEVASSERTLGSATIDRGDLTIRGGGNVLMLDEDDALLTKFSRGRASFFDPATGGRTDLYKGRIYLWDSDGGDGDPAGAGQVVVDQGAGRNLLRLFPPHESGTGLENSITIRGKSSSQTGMVWVYTDGSVLLNPDVSASITSKTIQLNTTGEEMPIYGLPTTSAGSNLHLGTVGGKWTMAYITSSQRYKQDIKDAPIDPAAALSWKPKVWRDISEVRAIGDQAKTHIGFIAEDVEKVSPEFVVHDDQGRPDSLNYDRMVAGVVATIQAQEKRAAEDRAKTIALEAKVNAQSQEIAALKDANAAIGLRLDKVTAALKKLGVTP